MAAKPHLLTVEPDGIPGALIRRPQWVLWRLVSRDDRWTKEPLQCNGRRASATDPKTWTDFETGLTVYRAGGSDGIGFVLTRDDGLFCVDLDGVRDPASGVLSELAQQWLALETYTELSPSGTGLHLWVAGVLPADPARRGGGRRAGPVEVYAYDRFMTVTGHRLEVPR